MSKKVLLWMFLFPLLLFSQNAESVLKMAREKFNSLDSFSAQFELITFREGSEGTKLRGKFFFKQKEKYRVELPNSTIVSVKDTIWNFEKKRKQIVITLKEGTTTFFDLKKLLFDYTEKFKIQLVNGSEGVKYLLEFRPKSAEADFKTALVGFDEKYLPVSVKINTKRGAVVKLNFSGFVFNRVKDTLFSWRSLSKGKIIDLR